MKNKEHKQLSKQQLKQQKLVRRLIEYFGTQAQMAQAIGIHQGGISSYLNGRHGISQTVAKTIERVTDGKFKAVDLCPRIGRHYDSRTD